MREGCVLVSGATGLVGRRLVPKLVGSVRSRAHAVPIGCLGHCRRRGSASWDGIDPGAAALVGVDAVVHLAGEPIFGGLPTKARLARIRESRVASTRRIVERIAALSEDARPRTFVCASAVGIYGDRGEEELDENSAPGSGYLADLCRDWEAEACRAEALGLRVVRVRIGVVLAREGGALSLMRIPFSLGLGGRLGKGRQFFPWIHIDDLVAAILWSLGRSEIRGAFNAVAPTAGAKRRAHRDAGPGSPATGGTAGAGLRIARGARAARGRAAREPCASCRASSSPRASCSAMRSSSRRSAEACGLAGRPREWGPLDGVRRLEASSRARVDAAEIRRAELRPNRVRQRHRRSRPALPPP